MGEKTVLQMRGICKSFPGVTALDQVDFDLREGEVHALVGKNGAGKSTLIRILAGVYSRDAGEVLVDGKRVEIHNSAAAQRLGLGFIHQELNLVPHFNAYENAMLGLRYPTNMLGLIKWRSLRKQIAEIARSLNIDFDLKSPVSALSSAQRRMVMIARALVRKAKIIVMDESTAALSEQEISILFRLIEELKRQKVSVIYISHRLEEIFTIADRVTVMRDGRSIATQHISEADLATLITQMLDKTLKEEYPKERIDTGPVLFSVHNLNAPGIRDITFDLHEGEILGVTGLLGSGKTELAQALFGVSKIKSGELYLGGSAISLKSPGDAIRQGIVLIPEERREQGLVVDMTVRENMTLPNLHKFLMFKGLGLLSRIKELGFVQELTESFSIGLSSHNQPVGFLSGGNQQKVVLAKWLGGRSRVVVMDEPTRGIDVGSKTEIYKLAGRMAEEGSGIILISSEVEELVGVCDRILILFKGRISSCLNAAETSSQEVVRSCYGR